MEPAIAAKTGRGTAVDPPKQFRSMLTRTFWCRHGHHRPAANNEPTFPEVGRDDGPVQQAPAVVKSCLSHNSMFGEDSKTVHSGRCYKKDVVDASGGPLRSVIFTGRITLSIGGGGCTAFDVML